jgi:hypothetical protein
MAILAVRLVWGMTLMSIASKAQAMGWKCLRNTVPRAVNAGMKIKTGKEGAFWIANSSESHPDPC